MSWKIAGNFLAAILLSAAVAAAGELEVSENAVMDFGSYPASETKEHEFVLTNRTSMTIALKKVRSTCGCLVGEVSVSQLLPGESTKLRTRVKAHSITGTFVRPIYVETDLPSKRFLKLELRGNARPLLEISPKPMLYAGTLRPQQEYEFKFTITPMQPNVALSFPERKDAVLKKIPNGWQFSCRIVPDGKTPQLESVYELKVETPSGWPPVKIEIRGMVAEADQE